MSKIVIVAVFTTFFLVACQTEKHKVHKMKKEVKKDLSQVKVVNEEDPICQMKTAEYLQDTAVYKGQVYGFCNTSCKEEFQKTPEKYTQ